MRNFKELYRMDLPHRAISVYRYLADRANIDGICWPSIPTISKDLKLSVSTTRRAIGDLRKAGLVQTEQRYRENGGNSSYQFYINFSTSPVLRRAHNDQAADSPSCVGWS